MTEAIYKRKHLMGGLLPVSEGGSMTVIAEGVDAGRQTRC